VLADGHIDSCETRHNNLWLTEAGNEARPITRMLEGGATLLQGNALFVPINVYPVGFIP
jgi:hypothetical protein